MRRPAVITLHAVFILSGISALIFQAGWQRVLSLNAGMDLFSVTTVVAAFMLGLGVGSLAGGWLADRLSSVAAVRAYAAAELVIGLFGLSSVWILYELYPRLAPWFPGTFGAFALHFLALLVPTVLMGATLPLLARGVVERAEETGPLVGRLYAVNTVGAALGALAMSGGWVLGRVGLDGSIRAAASLNLVCAVLAFVVLRASHGQAPEAAVEDAPRPRAFLIAVYGATGFACLGLEIVWFRLLNVVGLSSTYTFSRLLFLYLVGLGAGAALGSRLARRVKSATNAFFTLQLAIAFLALAGPFVVVSSATRYGAEPWFRDGVAPLLVLLAPTILMGMGFPLMQHLLGSSLSRLGRTTGLLLFANTLGCVAGSLCAGFLLLDRLGTPVTLCIFGGVLAAVGATGLLKEREPGATARTLVGLAIFIVAVVALPRGLGFWGPLHERPIDEVHEDGACLTALGPRENARHLYISGEIQNGVPFDEFHVRLGLVPMVLHPSPKRVLVIGLGAGSTAYAVALDPRVETIDCVEICPGEATLLKRLAASGSAELAQLFADPRLRLHFTDGRKYLLEHPDQRWDAIVTDTLLTQWSHSGSLYSQEFYRLARSRLADDGLFAQWEPSPRVYRTLASVFPDTHVVHAPHLDNNSPRVMVATQKPLPMDLAAFTERLDRTNHASVPLAMQAQLRTFFSTAQAWPETYHLAFPPDQLNRDLFPRDEYGNW